MGRPKGSRNKPKEHVEPGPLGDNAAGHLRSYIERVERLEQEKADIGSDIRDVYAEAKGNGFDTKALRAIVRRRRADAAALAEHEAIVETYMHALGMLADTPLGQAAIARDLPSMADPPFAPPEEVRV